MRFTNFVLDKLDNFYIIIDIFLCIIIMNYFYARYNWFVLLIRNLIIFEIDLPFVRKNRLQMILISFLKNKLNF